MARYTGPRARVSRRLGTNIWGTKGESIAMEKRPYPPGIHGRTRRRGNVSEYLVQLQEKQKARFTYGINEKQFRNLYREASHRPGVTGENLLRYCELRLDNIVYRAGWAATRPQARQFVSHGHVDVNGRRVNIASYRVRKGDVVRLRDKAAEYGRCPVEPGCAWPTSAGLVGIRRRQSGSHSARASDPRTDRHSGPRTAHRRVVLEVNQSNKRIINN
jgi:small subunit ribosomal protein S4